jgi:hypothetical protein
MEMTENEAESFVLKLCRSKPRGLGIPCMRVRKDGLKVVVDNNRFDSPILAEGSTWNEVLVRLQHAIGGIQQ